MTTTPLRWEGPLMEEIDDATGQVIGSEQPSITSAAPAAPATEGPMPDPLVAIANAAMSPPARPGDYKLRLEYLHDRSGDEIIAETRRAQAAAHGIGLAPGAATLLFQIIDQGLKSGFDVRHAGIGARSVKAQLEREHGIEGAEQLRHDAESALQSAGESASWLADLIVRSGAGNHPAVVNTLARAYRAKNR